MKSPDQINELIGQDLHDNTVALNHAKRSLEFHQSRQQALSEMMECDHQGVAEDSTHDRCRHCGYKWVR